MLGVAEKEIKKKRKKKIAPVSTMNLVLRPLQFPFSSEWLGLLWIWPRTISLFCRLCCLSEPRLLSQLESLCITVTCTPLCVTPYVLLGRASYLPLLGQMYFQVKRIMRTSLSRRRARYSREEQRSIVFLEWNVFARMRIHASASLQPQEWFALCPLLPGLRIQHFLMCFLHFRGSSSH